MVEFVFFFSLCEECLFSSRFNSKLIRFLTAKDLHRCNSILRLSSMMLLIGFTNAFKRLSNLYEKKTYAKK